MGSFDEALDGGWREFRERMETLGGRISLYIKQRDDRVRRHFVAVRRAGDEVLVWVSSNSAVEPAQRLDRSHHVRDLARAS